MHLATTFRMVVTVAALALIAGCGGSGFLSEWPGTGGTTTEGSVPVNIQVTSNSGGSYVDANGVTKDAGDYAEGGSDSGATSGQVDFVDVKCNFEYPFATTPNTGIQLIGGDSSVPDWPTGCTNPNKCLVCKTAITTTTAALTGDSHFQCVSSCEGRVPANSETASDIVPIVLRFDTYLKTDAADTSNITLVLRQDVLKSNCDDAEECNIAQALGVWDPLFPNQGVDLSSADGTPGTEMTIDIVTDALGINALVGPNLVTRGYAFSSLGTADGQGFRNAVVTNRQPINLKLTGAAWNAIDLERGPIVLASKLCDDNALASSRCVEGYGTTAANLNITSLMDEQHNVIVPNQADVVAGTLIVQFDMPVDIADTQDSSLDPKILLIVSHNGSDVHLTPVSIEYDFQIMNQRLKLIQPDLSAYVGDNACLEIHGVKSVSNARMASLFRQCFTLGETASFISSNYTSVAELQSVFSTELTSLSGMSSTTLTTWQQVTDNNAVYKDNVLDAVVYSNATYTNKSTAQSFELANSTTATYNANGNGLVLEVSIQDTPVGFDTRGSGGPGDAAYWCLANGTSSATCLMLMATRNPLTEIEIPRAACAFSYYIQDNEMMMEPGYCTSTEGVVGAYTLRLEVNAQENYTGAFIGFHSVAGNVFGWHMLGGSNSFVMGGAVVGSEVAPMTYNSGVLESDLHIVSGQMSAVDDQTGTFTTDTVSVSAIKFMGAGSETVSSTPIEMETSTGVTYGQMVSDDASMRMEAVIAR